MPSRSAARHTSSGSPTESAAASCNSRRVSAGSASSRRRKLVLEDRRAAGTPEPAGQLRGAHAARQFQQARAGCRASRRSSARGRADVEPAGDDGRQQGFASSWLEPFEPQLRQARERALIRSARGSANTIAIGSASIRRATNPQHLRRGAVEPLADRPRGTAAARSSAASASSVSAPGRAGSGRAARRTRSRARPAGHPAAAPGARRCGRAAARRADAARERQLHLGLDAGDLGDPEPGCPCRRRAASASSCPRPPRRGSRARRCGPRARRRAAGPAPARSLDRPRNAGGAAAAMVRITGTGATDQGLPRARRSAGSRDRYRHQTPNRKEPTMTTIDRAETPSPGRRDHDRRLQARGRDPARVRRRPGQAVLRVDRLAAGRRLPDPRGLPRRAADAARLDGVDHLRHRRHRRRARLGHQPARRPRRRGRPRRAVARGVDVSEVFHGASGFDLAGTDARVSGPDPERRSYSSWATFSDPDGNRWLLQELTTRLPGR